jgi:hypothetical protein
MAHIPLNQAGIYGLNKLINESNRHRKLPRLGLLINRKWTRLVVVVGRIWDLGGVNETVPYFTRQSPAHCR